MGEHHDPPYPACPLVLALGLVSGSAHAALQGRYLNGSAGSFEAYYDTDINITWMNASNNLNLAFASTWADANALAANLSITVGVNVYDNWRLPTAQFDASCTTYDNGTSYVGCTGGEVGHLSSIENGAGVFLPPLYWSGTEDASGNAWVVNTVRGVQFLYFKDGNAWVVAVHPGDVAAVPEANTWAMLLAGLALVGAATRRRRE